MSSSKPIDPWLGRCVGDNQRYRLDSRLGQGGMADVFLATDTLLGQPVALKLLKEKLVAGEMRQRFEREATLCAALHSEHIVQVSDYGVTSEGYPFYIMEYLRGQTLRQVLKRERLLSVPRTANIMAQICLGLHRAHQGVVLWQDGSQRSEPVKVVHRDLKPDNIFLISTALGELVKILDFGIAKIHNDQMEATQATSIFLGTYQYAAPEQLEVKRDLDERADIYSLGMILYEMLSGTDPFGLRSSQPSQSLTSSATWAVAHLTKPPLPLCQQDGCESLSPVLEAIVMRCLEKEPDRRFTSVMALNAALQQAVAEQVDRPSRPSDTPAILPAPLPPTSLSTSATATNVTATAAFATAPLTQLTQSLSPSRQPLRQPRRSAFYWFRPSPVLISGSVIAAIALGLGFVYSSRLFQSFALQPVSGPSPAPVSSSSPRPIPTALRPPPSNPAIASLVGHTDTVWSVALDPTNSTIVSGSYDKTIKLWNLNTGTLERTLAGHTDAVRSVAISGNGKFLVSGSGDKSIKLWQLPSGTLQRTFAGHSGPVWAVAISADGRTIASGSYDGEIKLWDTETGKLLSTLPEHYDSVWTVAISPDSQTLVSGGYDGAVRVWDLPSGTLRQTLSDHTDAVRSVAISADGNTFASGSWDKTIKIWDLQTGQLRRTLSGHSDRILSVAISPDGQMLASGSYDQTIKLWHLPTGQLLQTLTGHEDWVISLAFSADGSTLVSGSKDNTIKLWHSPKLTTISEQVRP